MSPVQIRQYTNVAALALLAYDHTVTWDREVNCIWCGTCDWALRVMFFLGRYGALTIHITNFVVGRSFMLEKQVMNCHEWFGFQTCATCVLLTNLQLISMLRVYALYERSIKIACFLICWFLFYTAVAALTGSKFIHLVKLSSDCMMEETSDFATVSFGVLCIHDQCILWGLTAHKYRDSVRRGWSTNPIIRLVMRDTSLACLAICCLLIPTMSYPYMFKHTGYILYCFLSALVSVLTCRMILNMRDLKSSDGSTGIDIATVDLEMTDLTQ